MIVEPITTKNENAFKLAPSHRFLNNQRAVKIVFDGDLSMTTKQRAECAVETHRWQVKLLIGSLKA